MLAPAPIRATVPTDPFALSPVEEPWCHPLALSLSKGSGVTRSP